MCAFYLDHLVILEHRSPLTDAHHHGHHRDRHHHRATSNSERPSLHVWTTCLGSKVERFTFSSALHHHGTTVASFFYLPDAQYTHIYTRKRAQMLEIRRKGGGASLMKCSLKDPHRRATHLLLHHPHVIIFCWTNITSSFDYCNFF